MHTRVIEGICTAGTLEKDEVVWQVRTRTRILHTQTHMSTAALHVSCMYYTQTAKAVCTPLYTPAYTGDGRDLYRRNAGER